MHTILASKHTQRVHDLEHQSASAEQSCVKISFRAERQKQTKK